MLPDIAEPKRPQQRIDDRVDHHIAVAVRIGADSVRDRDTAHHQLAAVAQAVDVVTVTDAEVRHSSLKRARRREGAKENSFRDSLALFFAASRLRALFSSTITVHTP